MAGQRLTDKTALNNHTGTGDLFMLVDVSDTTGSAAGTSKKIDSKFIIQTDKISVSSSDVSGLNTAPKTLVSAPGAGYAVIPLNFTLFNTYISTVTGKIKMIFGHTGTNDPNLSCAVIDNYMFGFTTDQTNITSNQNSLQRTRTTSIEDKPLYLSSSASFGAAFSVDVYVTYQIILLS
jgi:hypothetical protein